VHHTVLTFRCSTCPCVINPNSSPHTHHTGKGTSAKDGSALSGALLEHLDRRNITGVFATHLHELFMLPLQLRNVRDKKMGYEQDADGELNLSECGNLR